MKRNVVSHLTAAFWICAASLQAHHSHGAIYDLCKSGTIEGRIDAVQWKNPHSWIDVKLDDGTTYHVEWTSPQLLTRQGAAVPAQDALTFGARVVVTGHPPRDAAVIRASYPSFKDDPDPRVVDPTEIRRADGSFRWAVPSPLAPECGRQ